MTKSQKKKKLIFLLTVMVAFAILSVFRPLLYPFIVDKMFSKFNVVSSKNNLLVHFIDVGQGDAIALNFPNGKTMVIDTGPVESSVTFTNYISNQVLKNKTSKTIDYLILTHADADHCGGIKKLLENFDVSNLYMPKVESTSNFYQDLLQFVNDNYEYDIIGSQFLIHEKEFKVECFGPLDYKSTNNTCPLIKISYLGKTFLFTGDLDKNAEKKFANMDINIDCDVLKVAHHGSNYASSELFLNETTPDYAVISVGINTYGHPGNETINRLDNAGATTLRTDENGNIMFVVGDHYDLNYKCGGYYITNLSLDYTYLILIVEICFSINIIVILIRKTKKK